ncbi:acyl-CoA dehydrogenase family protein [Carbonactinospora thermoautotrophica]|uniref:acyl-CoA dehydrogenase family protein n=1 Tax=Carbonactinospora thermoautotrophica TaxID=1469144 RepID=UPI0022710520|nr:acyl-CoA dehydrogenase family protein [Carbonactinospora thermoautotrophica]
MPGKAAGAFAQVRLIPGAVLDNRLRLEGLGVMTTTQPTAPASPPDPLPSSQVAAALARLPGVVATLAANAAQHDREASFPHEGVEAVHEAGLLTLTVATRYGGPGAGLAETVRVLRELGRGDPSVALVTAMTLFTHAEQAHLGTWPDRYYRRLLAETAAGPALVNALRAEPDLGTPTRGGLPATVARRTARGWSITGRKIYSTGSVGLKWMVVWAATDENPVRVGGFIVRGDAPGVTVEPTWDHLGLRASASHDVVLTDVEVDEDATTGLTEAGTGGGLPAVVAAWHALGLPALYLGVAEAARDWLVKFLRERTPSALGAPLATLARFQAAVGEIEARLIGAEELITGLARRIDAGDEEALARAPVAKLLATRAAIRAVERAVALTGNPGLTRGNPLERHYRDVLCARVHTPQDDSILGAVGRSVLAPPDSTEGI